MTGTINTVIFDLGGVLIDWNPDYVFKEIFPEEEELTYFYDHICTPEWNEMQDAGRPIDIATAEKVKEYPAFEEAIRSFYGRWTEMIGGAFVDTVEILEKLKSSSRFTLIAMTNWSAETFPYARENFEFLKWFDHILVSGEEKLKKPDPAFFDLLFNRFKVSKETAVFVDDNSRNVEAATEYGIESIHYQGSSALFLELKRLGIF